MKKSKLRKLFFIPDCHHPNVSEGAWSLMLRVASYFEPDDIVIMGDFADAETLSAHAPTKPGIRDFEDELESVKKALDQLDALGASNKIYVSGNHEFRLDRYMMENAPGLYRSVQWQSLLDLKGRGWTWVPYRKSIRLGKLHLTHDVGSAGMNAHRVAARAFGGSAAIGHSHRLAYEVTGRFDGPPYLAAMFGWLGDASKAGDYLHEARSSDWVHGLGIGYLEPSGIVHVTPIPFVNGRCVVEGELFE
jgi:predicted phosphodiesterase